MQFMDSFVFYALQKPRVGRQKPRGQRRKRGPGFGRQSQIKKKQPRRVKSNMQTGGKKSICLAFWRPEQWIYALLSETAKTTIGEKVRLADGFVGFDAQSEKEVKKWR